VKKFYFISFGTIVAIILLEVQSRYSQRLEEIETAIFVAKSQKSALMTQYESLLREKKHSEQTWALAPALWISRDDNAPFGEVQTALAALAAKSGANLKSLQTAKPDEIAGFPTVRITLEVEADTQSWQKLLRELHQHLPTLLPVSAQLRRVNRDGSEAKYPVTLVRLAVDAPYVLNGGN